MNWEILRKGIVRVPALDFQVSCTGYPHDYQDSAWQFRGCVSHKASIELLKQQLAWSQVLTHLEQNKALVEYLQQFPWDLTACNFSSMIAQVIDAAETEGEFGCEIKLLQRLVAELEQYECGLDLPQHLTQLSSALATAQGELFLEKLCRFYIELDGYGHFQRQYPSLCCNNPVLFNLATQLDQVQLAQGEQILQALCKDMRLPHLFTDVIEAWEQLAKQLEVTSQVASLPNSAQAENSCSSLGDERQGEDIWKCCALVVYLATLVRLLRLYANAARQYRNIKIVKSKLQKFALSYAEHTTNLLLLARYRWCGKN